MKLKSLSVFIPLSLLAAPAVFAEDSLPRPAPIREVSVKISVRRGYLAEADIMKNFQPLCELTGKFPVYAPVPDPYKVVREYANFMCKTEVEGEAVQVQVSGAVYLESATAAAPAKKTLRATIFANQNGAFIAAQPSYAATTDLSAKNLELYMNSATYDLPEIKPGTPAFTVVITMDDTN